MKTLIIKRKNGENDGDLQDRAAIQLLKSKYLEVDVKHKRAQMPWDTMNREQARKHLEQKLKTLEDLTSVEAVLKFMSVTISLVRKHLARKRQIQAVLNKKAS